MIGWKKNLRSFLALNVRVELLAEQKLINKGGDNLEHLPKISLVALALMLGINRTSVYYERKPPTDFEIKAKHRIDEIHTAHPAWGQRQLSDQLKFEGIQIGRRKMRRFMEEMAIKTMYPKPNLSKPAKNSTLYPYLLKYFVATAPNQAWSIDITYIRLSHGFIYLTAIIDWYSRCIVGWELDDTLETAMVKRALNKAFVVATPKILNSDQGSQFTSGEYISFVSRHWDVKISMDGVGRWADNIPIERWFRTLKYDEVYLNQYENIKDARRRIGLYIIDYNYARTHSAIGHVPPAYIYFPVLLCPELIR